MEAYRLCSIVIFTFIILPSVHLWNLSKLGIKEYTILHATIHKNQVYLTIKQKYSPQSLLIQTSWSEESNTNPKALIITTKHDDQCQKLQNIIATDIDMGKIWILDKGNKKCPGKLVVINIYTNQLIRIYKFSNKYKVSSLVVEHVFLLRNQNAYIGTSNKNAIIICPLKYMNCYVHYLHLTNGNELISNVKLTENIALSAARNALYITSSDSTNLYMVKLNRLALYEENDTNNTFHIGEMLGPSKALFTGLKNKLCYYLTRDYAIVCWNMEKPFNAEGHEVLDQSYVKYPSLVQILLDGRNLWAITNPNENELNNPKNSLNRRSIKVL